MDIKAIIQKLYDTNDASREELLYLLDNIDDESKKFLIDMAYKTRLKYYGNTVTAKKIAYTAVLEEVIKMQKDID